MKNLIAGAIAAAALFGAGAACAADINPAGMTSAEVVAWLQKAGYKTELRKGFDDRPLIDSAAKGVDFTVDFYDCEGTRCRALQFFAVFDSKTPPTLQKLNEWNRTKRYLKTYLSEGGAVRVEYDVNVNAGRNTDGLDDDFGVWTTMLSDFKTYLGR